MPYSRPPGAYQSGLVRAHTVDPGHELPLSVDGGTGRLLDRHRISLHWLVATVLAAFCGAALMSGAVIASLDRETITISRPEEAEHFLRGAIDAGVVDESRKGDSLAIAARPAFIRQAVHISTVTGVGDRQLVRAQSFVRVGGKLLLTASGLLAKIPPYNPQRLLAASAPGGKESPEAAAQPDTTVSFVMRDLAHMIPRIKTKFVTPLAEVMARVRQAADWSRGAADHAPAQPGVTGIALAYADEGARDPFAGLHARIVPENVTLKAKTATRATGGTPFEKRVIAVKKGDAVSTILRRLGATADQIAAVLPLLGSYGSKSGLHGGDKLQVLLAPGPDGKDRRLLRLIVADASGPKAVAALADNGKYVSVDPASVDDAWAATGDRTPEKKVVSRISLYQSVYETALRNHVPDPIIEDLIRIFSFDVDFDGTVQPGDSFQVLYAGTLHGATPDDRNDILFASLTVGGRTKRLYRFQPGDRGSIDYYDDGGRSARKFLLRKPLAMGEITSGFGWRRHPLLGYVAMHTGVDWGAPAGTPIYAAGNGVIEKENWQSGYGNFILLRHANGYETAYGHMSAYARGTHVGERVKQGEVIGFVGSTGLATGSHLHFEIRLNGHFVDPMRVKLPDGHKLHGPLLAAFEQERERIDRIMARKPRRIASRRATSVY